MTSRAAAKMKDFPGFCEIIRHSINKAIRTASLALKYDYCEPRICFGCPCGNPSYPSFHLATIAANNKQWICAKDTDEFDDLEGSQLVWLEEGKNKALDSHASTRGSQMVKDHDKRKGITEEEDRDKDEDPLKSTPKSYELDLLQGHGKKIKIIEHVSAKWDRVATRLHFELHVIDTIRRDCTQQATSACQTVFAKWLNGEGRKPVNWRTLIDALAEADLSFIAQELEDFIKAV